MVVELLDIVVRRGDGILSGSSIFRYVYRRWRDNMNEKFNWERCYKNLKKYIVLLEIKVIFEDLNVGFLCGSIDFEWFFLVYMR